MKANADTESLTCTKLPLQKLLRCGAGGIGRTRQVHYLGTLVVCVCPSTDARRVVCCLEERGERGEMGPHALFPKYLLKSHNLCTNRDMYAYQNIMLSPNQE